jgi:hypothetical protein
VREAITVERSWVRISTHPKYYMEMVSNHLDSCTQFLLILSEKEEGKIKWLRLKKHI